MFLCHVPCNVWLEQIYPDDILLLDTLLSHLVMTQIRPESAGSEDDRLTVNVFLYVCVGKMNH